MKNTHKFRVGQLVKWYEAYADGFLGRDAGIGVVTEIRVHNLGYHDGPYINYKVLRNKHGDIMSFGEEYIESMEEHKERMDAAKADHSICS